MGIFIIGGLVLAYALVRFARRGRTPVPGPPAVSAWQPDRQHPFRDPDGGPPGGVGPDRAYRTGLVGGALHAALGDAVLPGSDSASNLTADAVIGKRVADAPGAPQP